MLHLPHQMATKASARCSKANKVVTISLCMFNEGSCSAKSLRRFSDRPKFSLLTLRSSVDRRSMSEGVASWTLASNGTYTFALSLIGPAGTPAALIIEETLREVLPVIDCALGGVLDRARQRAGGTPLLPEEELQDVSTQFRAQAKAAAGTRPRAGTVEAGTVEEPATEPEGGQEATQGVPAAEVHRAALPVVIAGGRVSIGRCQTAHECGVFWARHVPEGGRMPDSRPVEEGGQRLRNQVYVVLRGGPQDKSPGRPSIHRFAQDRVRREEHTFLVTGERYKVKAVDIGYLSRVGDDLGNWAGGVCKGFPSMLEAENFLRGAGVPLDEARDLRHGGWVRDE